MNQSQKRHEQFILDMSSKSFARNTWLDWEMKSIQKRKDFGARLRQGIWIDRNTCDGTGDIEGKTIKSKTERNKWLKRKCGK